MAQARAQDLDDVLNISYVPTTKEEILLFNEKKKFMYAVFEKTLLTDKGKALVRAHQSTYDAQTIYKELLDYASTSTKATMDATALLSYITTSNINDGKWKGTSHAYIIHWQDQVRKYHDLNPSQTLSDDILRTLLQMQSILSLSFELSICKLNSSRHIWVMILHTRNTVIFFFLLHKNMIRGCTRHQ